jgi:hypothetical protein
MKLIFTFCVIAFISGKAYGQGSPPWERPLMITVSADGQNFSPATIFQDSSGVPSMIRWKGDTLVCVFQWFRQPMNSITWDQVAVKYSYDAGQTWTNPVPIIVTGMPSSYQRPFDPALATINQDSIRIFFSSSDGYPVNGGDSIINTYSAISTDGVNYIFEPGARYDNSTQRVIDPSAIVFNGHWHYAAPIGAPQDGAYHCTSADGLNFTRQPDYLSDMQHNWTGNFVLNSPNELRFYGSGQYIWYNSSSDGFTWTGFQNTNVTGGDPTVVKTDSADFIMVYTGSTYTTSIHEIQSAVSIYPNPVYSQFTIEKADISGQDFFIYDIGGKVKLSGMLSSPVDVSSLLPGTYVLIFQDRQHRPANFRFVKR